MAEGTRKNPLEYQREYNEFMYKLKRFLTSKDMPMKKLPQFGGQDIDLYLLYKTVTNLGGWLKVTDDRNWHEVAKNFNLPPSCLNSAFALRQLYVR
ncbi:AT-rich interactive domain-containing 2-like, partial [Paramuricea clavata]